MAQTRTIDDVDFLEAIAAITSLEAHAATLTLTRDPDDNFTGAMARAALRLADRIRAAWDIPRPTEAELDAAAEARWGLPDDAPLAAVQR